MYQMVIQEEGHTWDVSNGNTGGRTYAGCIKW